MSLPRECPVCGRDLVPGTGVALRPDGWARGVARGSWTFTTERPANGEFPSTIQVRCDGCRKVWQVLIQAWPEEQAS
jgi:hypothetical protein